MALNWKGREVKNNVRKAQIVGVNTTMAACVIEAKRRAPVDTGVLQGSINTVIPARPSGNGVAGTWGSQSVVYAIFQELGTSKMPAQPYLRPAADEQYPLLAKRIKGALK